MYFINRKLILTLLPAFFYQTLTFLLPFLTIRLIGILCDSQSLAVYFAVTNLSVLIVTLLFSLVIPFNARFIPQLVSDSDKILLITINVIVVGLVFIISCFLTSIFIAYPSRFREFFPDIISLPVLSTIPFYIFASGCFNLVTISLIARRDFKRLNLVLVFCISLRVLLPLSKSLITNSRLDSLSILQVIIISSLLPNAVLLQKKYLLNIKKMIFSIIAFARQRLSKALLFKEYKKITFSYMLYAAAAVTLQFQERLLLAFYTSPNEYSGYILQLTIYGIVSAMFISPLSLLVWPNIYAANGSDLGRTTQLQGLRIKIVNIPLYVASLCFISNILLTFTANNYALRFLAPNQSDPMSLLDQLAVALVASLSVLSSEYMRVNDLFRIYRLSSFTKVLTFALSLLLINRFEFLMHGGVVSPVLFLSLCLSAAYIASNLVNHFVVSFQPAS